MTTISVVKRVNAGIKNTNSLSFNNNCFKNVDLLVSNWLRSSLKEKNKSNICTLFPLDLCSLISNYQNYVCIFDIYDNLLTKIENNKHNQIVTIKRYTIQTIFASQKLEYNNIVSIKIIKFTGDYSSFATGFTSFCDDNYTGKYLSYSENKPIIYGEIKKEKTTFYGNKNDGERFNILDTIIGHIKQNDIIKMKYMANKLIWNLNEKELYFVDLIKSTSIDNMYFAIATGGTCENIVLEIK